MCLLQSNIEDNGTICHAYMRRVSENTTLYFDWISLMLLRSTLKHTSNVTSWRYQPSSITHI